MTAPGLDALRENAPTGRSDTTIGTFWHITTGPDGRTITWHNGKTGGYTSYMGLDLENRRAVIVRRGGLQIGCVPRAGGTGRR